MKKIENGCPLCEDDVAGDSETLYYCKNCNLLFTEENLRIERVEGSEE